MTDPVDTDALDTSRLRSVASTLHSKAFHLMNAAADEVDRLRAELDAWEPAWRNMREQRDKAWALIENAPHDVGCATPAESLLGVPRDSERPCTCWKAGL